MAKCSCIYGPVGTLAFEIQGPSSEFGSFTLQIGQYLIFFYGGRAPQPENLGVLSPFLCPLAIACFHSFITKSRNTYAKTSLTQGTDTSLQLKQTNEVFKEKNILVKEKI